MMIEVPVSSGELVDKMTILEIKVSKLHDKVKINHAKHELELLKKKLAQICPDISLIEGPLDQLRKTNEKLWEIEDRLRELEKQSQFDSEFIELARRVYITNDLRFSHKSVINKLLNSEVIEVKSYCP